MTKPTRFAFLVIVSLGTVLAVLLLVTGSSGQETSNNVGKGGESPMLLVEGPTGQPGGGQSGGGQSGGGQSGGGQSGGGKSMNFGRPGPPHGKMPGVPPGMMNKMAGQMRRFGGGGAGGGGGGAGGGGGGAGAGSGTANNVGGQGSQSGQSGQSGHTVQY